MTIGSLLSPGLGGSDGKPFSAREAISWVATTGGIHSGDIRDLMIESVERRFGLVNRLPLPIEWLSDNGSPYTAHKTRALAHEIGLVPCTTPIEAHNPTASPRPS